MLNFATICRVCMKSDKELNQIFDESLGEKSIGIAAMMDECSKYKVLRHDGLPQHICSLCLKSLKSAYRWRENCEKSYRHLLKILENSRNNKDVDCIGYLKSHISIFHPDADYTSQSHCHISQRKCTHKEHMKQHMSLMRKDSEAGNGKCDRTEDHNELKSDAMAEVKSDNVEYPLSANTIEPMHTVLIEETCDINDIKREHIGDEDANDGSINDERINDEDPIFFASCEESNSSSCISSSTDNKRKTTNSLVKTKYDYQSHSKKRLTCRECGQKFTTRDALLVHKQSESHCRIWLCQQCGLRCKSSSNLKDHMRRHNGDKPHKCKFCNKSFTRMVDLRTHEKFHTDEKSHFCEICGRGFQLKYSLTTHLRLHTGEKPYKCPHCPQTFSRGGDLKMHSRHHTGDRLRCDLCDASYLEARKLRKHKLTKHGIKEETPRRRVAKYTSPKQQEQQIKKVQLQQTSP